MSGSARLTIRRLAAVAIAIPLAAVAVPLPAAALTSPAHSIVAASMADPTDPDVVASRLVGLAASGADPTEIAALVTQADPHATTTGPTDDGG
ncbi:MAG: hypothetical protein LBK72_09405, partial [Bifidobacteriaceae bacterium]|nr:hypothetical protein [Bifidobacteriaceae bacterium]